MRIRPPLGWEPIRWKYFFDKGTAIKAFIKFAWFDGTYVRRESRKGSLKDRHIVLICGQEFKVSRRNLSIKG